MTQIPPALERVAGVPGRVHLGTYWYPLDFSQYLAAMNEGARSSSWLIHNHLTAEPHEPILMYPLYVAIGKLASWLQIPILSAYAAVELVTRVVLPISIYLLAAAALAEVWQRRFSFVLASFSSGLSAWTWLLPGGDRLVDGGSADLIRANTYLEVMTFGIYFAAPHVGVGLAATLLATVLFVRAANGSRRALALLVLDMVLLALVHPFNLPVLLTAFGVLAVVESLRRSRPAWPFLWAAGLGGVVSAPFVLQSFLTYTFDPFWGKTYGTQNVMPSPPPWLLPIDYGIVLPLGVVGALVAWRRSSPMWRMLLVWLVVGLVWMYLPLSYQRRFAFGLQPVLAVLAALGWPTVQGWAAWLARRLTANPQIQAGLARRLAHYSLLTLGFATTIVTFLVLLLSTIQNFPVEIFLVDQDTYAVGQWIAEQSGPNDVVAASFKSGNVIGGLVSGRVVVGYRVATLNFGEKLRTIEAMYRGELSESEIRAFLDHNRATYLLVGPEERKLGPSDPGVRLNLPAAIRVGETTGYRIPR